MSFLDLPDRNGKKPTAKQIETRKRNWELRKLRAFFHLCPVRLPTTRNRILKLIDGEIKRLGGESEIERQATRLKALEE